MQAPEDGKGKRIYAAQQSEIIRLSFMEERPHSEIAALLGIPLGTVKSRIRLAMNRLRELLDALK